MGEIARTTPREAEEQSLLVGRVQGDERATAEPVSLAEGSCSAADVCLCTAMFVGATLVAGAGGSASARERCSLPQQAAEECSKVARGCDKSDIDILSSVGGSGDSSRRALQAFSHGEGNQLGVWRAQPAADFHRDAPLFWSFEVRPAPAASALPAAVQPVRMRDSRS
jgi:hypothetical protein